MRSFMDAFSHNLNSLFEQLGIPSTDDEIMNFLLNNNKVPSHIQIHQAKFWSPAQAEFIRTALAENSSWSGVIGSLDTLLR